MSDLFNQKYRIKSARCNNWDYGSNACYFITICTAGKVHHFGEILSHQMILSDAGKIVQKYWSEIPEHFDFIELNEFIIMPNHIHGLLTINKWNRKINDDKQLDVICSKCFDAIVVETRQCLVSTNETNNPNETDNPNKPNDNNIPETTIGRKRFRNPGKDNISSVIGSFKSVCTKNIHIYFPDVNFAWQARFHDHIVRDNEEYRRIQQYIVNNPLNWIDDKFY